MPRLVRALVLGVVLGAVLLLGGMANAQETSAPVQGEYTLAPLVLDIPPGSVVQVRDEVGRVVVPASASDASALRLPVLLPGRYTATVNGADFPFTVAADSLAAAPWGPHDDPAVPWWALLWAGSGLALIAASAWRKSITGVLTGAALGVTGLAAAVLLAPTGSYVEQMNACGPLRDHWPIERGQCVLTFATAALAAGDVPAALSPLQASDTCHDVGHELGRRAGSLLPAWEDALVPQAAVCQEGFIHGVMYAGAMYLDDAAYLELALSACRTWQDQPGFSMPSCAHGIGHGALFRWSGDLEAALTVCEDVLPGTENDALRVECRGGAMSAWAYLKASAPTGPQWPLGSGEQLTAQCALVTDAADAHECYAGVAAAARPQPGQEDDVFSGLLGVCVQDAADEWFLAACTSGVAKSAQEWYAGDPRGAQVCRGVEPGRGRLMCAVGYALSQQYDAPQTADPIEVCALADVPWTDCRELIGTPAASEV